MASRLLVSGGEDDVVYRFHFADGRLSRRETIDVLGGKKAAIPTGLACSRDGQSLYVACCQGHALRTVSLRYPERLCSISLPEGSWPYTVAAGQEVRPGLC